MAETKEDVERHARVMQAVDHAIRAIAPMFDGLAIDARERVEMDLSLVGSIACSIILGLDDCPCLAAAVMMNAMQQALLSREISSEISIPKHHDLPEGAVH